MAQVQTNIHTLTLLTPSCRIMDGYIRGICLRNRSYLVIFEDYMRSQY
jgi:hypothetical protein